MNCAPINVLAEFITCNQIFLIASTQFSHSITVMQAQNLPQLDNFSQNNYFPIQEALDK
jgi:hypothetical protein